MSRAGGVDAVVSGVGLGAALSGVDSGVGLDDSGAGVGVAAANWVCAAWVP
jgi:hypothetical protein